MQQIQQLQEVRDVLRDWRQQGQSIALVPTMGNLHAGHLSLVEKAKDLGDRVVVSIFVNPLQFGQGEDFASYPRTIEQDSAHLQELGVDLLFLPDEQALYPAGRKQTTLITVPGLSSILCGAYREGHFDGVATVVAKFFNIVQPDVAVFGKKDYQQLLLIRRMVRELDMPVEIFGVDTVREHDGLAMSSRNQYLNAEERQQAVLISRTLLGIADQLKSGRQDYSALCQGATEKLTASGYAVDYVEIRRSSDLLPAEPGDKDLVALLAARLGGARLIDNVEISL